mmetsp:Transcript_35888/g.83791  ORF Transcript_35888/g.83791 Transcript_35888/m.83791 type:complete len:220 (+) Transcript_35888:426-1085(+)
MSKSVHLRHTRPVGLSHASRQPRADGAEGHLRLRVQGWQLACGVLSAAGDASRAFQCQRARDVHKRLDPVAATPPPRPFTPVRADGRRGCGGAALGAFPTKAQDGARVEARVQRCRAQEQRLAPAPECSVSGAPLLRHRRRAAHAGRGAGMRVAFEAGRPPPARAARLPRARPPQARRGWQRASLPQRRLRASSHAPPLVGGVRAPRAETAVASAPLAL